MNLGPRTFYLAVFVLAAILLFAGLGSFPLTDRDEGEYASSAAFMLESGDFVVPTLNGRPYLEKPIFFFWTLAASFKMLGQNEFAARFPSAVAAFVLLCSMFWAVEQVVGDRRAGKVSVLVLLASPLFLLVARACLTDMLLSLFVWASMIFFYFYLASRRFMLLVLCWFFLALGFLTKGPVTLAMSLPVFLAYSAAKRDFSWLRPERFSISVMVFLLVSLPWYVAIYQRMGASFIETFFLTQNLERFATTLLGHGGGPIFYIIVLAVGCFPMSFFFPPVLARGFPLMIKGVKVGIRAKDSLFIFCFMTSVWIFVLLTIAATKQMNYIVPALPFLSVCLALSVSGLSSNDALAPSKASRILIVFLAVIFFLVSGLLLLFPEFVWERVLTLVRFDSTEYAFTQRPPPEIRLLAFTLLIFTLPIPFVFLKTRVKFCTRFFVAVFFSSFFVVWFLPKAACIFQGPARQLAKEVRYVLHNRASHARRERVKLVSFGLWKPSMIFYTGRPIFRIKTKHPDRLANALSKNDSCLVFTRVRLRHYLEKVPGFIAIKRQGGYLLGGNRAGVLLFKEGLP